MKSLIKKLSVKKVIYAFLTFVLALCLIACSFTMVIRVTFFNQSFFSDILNSTDYYKDLCGEITENLTDLGNASGLDKSFFEGFVDEVLVREDVQTYIDDFYENKTLKVSTANFEDNLQTALKNYIKEKDIKKTDEEAINSFIAKACKIYSNSVRIAYLSSLQETVRKYTPYLTIAIVVLLVVSAGIVFLMIFTNEWKHKSIRYIYISVCSSGIFLMMIPVCFFMSRIVNHISIISRSLSDLYVSMINSVFYDILVIAVVLLVISVVLWVIHGKVRKKSAL